MILTELCDYYHRKESELPPDGWIKRGLDFVVVLNNEGNFVALECLQTTEGRKINAKPVLLPNIGKQALKHNNSGKDANLLWDNSGFVLGLNNKGNIKLESFISTIEERLHSIKEKSIDALLLFLRNGKSNPSIFDPIVKHREYGEELASGNPILTFRMIENDGLYIFEIPTIRQRISTPEKNEHSIFLGTCLISGKTEQEIESSHTVIKGVFGAQTSGAAIVSFNKDAFCSYGKTKSFNAPVSKVEAQKYIKAINHLIEGQQSIRVGDATTVFWSAKPTELESNFSLLFDEPPKDDPDRLTNAVKSLYRSLDTGALAGEIADTRFFVLGLSPNAARVSVRFWHTGSVAEFSHRIAQYFLDLDIVHAPHQRESLSIWFLLKSIAALQKSENIPPNLAGEWMRSILSGLPYPETLLHAAIRRIRAERNVSYAQAAIVKASLNNKIRFYRQPEKEITVSLDLTNISPGYRLGRLFATLEKIQEEAAPGINATIRDRYYSAASGTPASVMPILMRLKNHHLGKLEKGRTIWFERLLAEVLAEIADFPNQLNLQEQGRFAIGYYHQRQAFFTKSQNTKQGA